MVRAIAEGWTPEHTELAVLKAARPATPAIHTGGNAPSEAVVLEASLCLAGGVRNPDKRFTPQVLDAAQRMQKVAGLQHTLIQAARANGDTGAERVHTGNMMQVLRAAFSTTSLPNMFANVANKFLLDGYSHVDDSWRAITKIASANDFKTQTFNRLTGSLKQERLGADGEIQHGKLGEDTYTGRVYTWAKMISITEEAIINDDLGALADVPRELGRGAALNFNEQFWTAFLGSDNTSGFVAGNGNYQTSSALSITTLGAAVALFRQMTDSQSNLMGTAPKFLLVPPGLEATAKALFTSTEVRDTTSSTKYGTSNIWSGMFQPVVSPYLAQSAMGGAYSNTTWYLLADPMDTASMLALFLNGQQQPTVETDNTEFNTLGIQMRSVLRFGVDFLDYRAGVKSISTAS